MNTFKHKNMLISEAKMTEKFLTTKLMTINTRLYKIIDIKQQQELLNNIGESIQFQEWMEYIRNGNCDCFNFIDKKEAKKLSQKHILEKNRNAIATMFAKDSLETIYKGTDFLQNGSFVFEMEYLDSKYFNLATVMDIKCILGNNINFDFLSISISKRLRFKEKISIIPFIDFLLEHKLLNAKTWLPIGYITSANNYKKGKIINIKTGHELSHKERQTIITYNPDMTDEIILNKQFGVINFYNDSYNKKIHIPIESIYFDVGSTLSTLHDKISKVSGSELETTTQELMDISLEYKAQKDIINIEAKSFIARTQIVEDIMFREKYGFNQYLQFNKVDAVIKQVSNIYADRRLEKKPIKVSIVCDKYSAPCIFYQSLNMIKKEIMANRDIQENDIQLDLIVAPLFMLDSENATILNDVCSYITSQIKKNKSNVAMIFWPKRLPSDIVDIKENFERYYDADNKIEDIMNAIPTYQSPVNYMDYKIIPKNVLEYHILSIGIMVQNVREDSYKDNTYEEAKFPNLQKKMRNIITSTLTKTENVASQLRFLCQKGVKNVTVIISYDITRNRQPRASALNDCCCYTAHFIPVDEFGNEILDYKYSAISTNQFYKGKGEMRDISEIEDFYKKTINLLENYQLNCMHVLIIRDGVLYEEASKIKEIIDKPLTIMQLKKANIVSFVDPERFQEEQSWVEKNNVWGNTTGVSNNVYTLKITPDDNPFLKEDEFLIGASVKNASKETIKKESNDKDTTNHCRTLHRGTIILNNSQMDNNQIIDFISDTMLCHTTIWTGICMLPYAQHMSDRALSELGKDSVIDVNFHKIINNNNTNIQSAGTDMFKIYNDFGLNLGTNMWG